MTDKKLPKRKKADLEWQKEIAKRLKEEKVELNDPQGLERFQKVMQRLGHRKKK